MSLIICAFCKHSASSSISALLKASWAFWQIAFFCNITHATDEPDWLTRHLLTHIFTVTCFQHPLRLLGNPSRRCVLSKRVFVSRCEPGRPFFPACGSLVHACTSAHATCAFNSPSFVCSPLLPSTIALRLTPDSGARLRFTFGRVFWSPWQQPREVTEMVSMGSPARRESARELKWRQTEVSHWLHF